MELFRIATEEHSKYLKSSGTPNRWNRKGEFVIYAGSSRSLSTLELVVHRNFVKPDVKYKVMIISIPDISSMIKTIEIKDLPKSWRSLEAYSTLQALGSEWYNSNETLLLKVPSAIIPYEWNYIINTSHPDFLNNVHLIKLESYFWDGRLL